MDPTVAATRKRARAVAVALLFSAPPTTPRISRSSDEVLRGLPDGETDDEEDDLELATMLLSPTARSYEWRETSKYFE
jgi:hypothetical protein